MSTIIRKKRNEVIKKVKVRMACACGPSQYTCGCICTDSDEELVKDYGPAEADQCAFLYYKKFFKNEIS